MGSEFREFMSDIKFRNKLNSLELMTKNSIFLAVQNFSKSYRTENDVDLINNMLKEYQRK